MDTRASCSELNFKGKIIKLLEENTEYVHDHQ